MGNQRLSTRCRLQLFTQIKKGTTNKRTARDPRHYRYNRRKKGAT